MTGILMRIGVVLRSSCRPFNPIVYVVKSGVLGIARIYMMPLIDS